MLDFGFPLFSEYVWFFLWLYGGLSLILIGGFIRGSVQFVKGWDIRWDKERAIEIEKEREKRPGQVYNLRKGRSQETVVTRLGLPLGALAIGVMLFHYFFAFNFTAYTIIGVCWFLSASVRRYWQNAVAIRLDEKLFKLGFNDQRYIDTDNAGEATRLYYARGVAPKSVQAKKRRFRMFEDRLAWANKFAWLVRWVKILRLRYLKLIIPGTAEFFASLIWPVSMMFMTYHHCREVYQHGKYHDSLKPWWTTARV